MRHCRYSFLFASIIICSSTIEWLILHIVFLFLRQHTSLASTQHLILSLTSSKHHLFLLQDLSFKFKDLHLHLFLVGILEVLDVLPKLFQFLLVHIDLIFEITVLLFDILLLILFTLHLLFELVYHHLHESLLIFLLSEHFFVLKLCHREILLILLGCLIQFKLQLHVFIAQLVYLIVFFLNLLL